MNFANQNSLHSEYGGYGLPTCFSGYKNDRHQSTTNFAKNVQLGRLFFCMLFQYVINDNIDDA